MNVVVAAVVAITIITIIIARVVDDYEGGFASQIHIASATNNTKFPGPANRI